MSEIPPQDFVAYPREEFVQYPRGKPHYGSADKLQALSDGYFGLGRVFAINFALAMATRAIPSDMAPIAWLGVIAGMFVLVALLTYPLNKRIAYGKNWPDSGALLASMLMGLNSALCCGVLGYIVMQSLAQNEIKRYGIMGGMFGLKKKDVNAVVARMRMAEQAPPPLPPGAAV